MKKFDIRTLYSKFGLLIIGKKSIGKTTLCHKISNNLTLMYSKIYHFTSYDDNFVDELNIHYIHGYQRQHCCELLEYSIKNKILVIFDNCLFRREFTKEDEISNIFYNKNISCIFTTNYVSQMPQMMRKKFSHVLVMRTESITERAKLYDTFFCNIETFKEFSKIMETNTINYESVLINNNNKEMYYISDDFDKVVFPYEEFDDDNNITSILVIGNKRESIYDDILNDSNFPIKIVISKALEFDGAFNFKILENETIRNVLERQQEILRRKENAFLNTNVLLILDDVVTSERNPDLMRLMFNNYKYDITVVLGTTSINNIPAIYKNSFPPFDMIILTDVSDDELEKLYKTFHALFISLDILKRGYKLMQNENYNVVISMFEQQNKNNLFCYNTQ